MEMLANKEVYSTEERNSQIINERKFLKNVQRISSIYAVYTK